MLLVSPATRICHRFSRFLRRLACKWCPRESNSAYAQQVQMVKTLCDEWADNHTYLQMLCVRAGYSMDEVENGDAGMLTIQELGDMLFQKVGKP